MDVAPTLSAILGITYPSGSRESRLSMLQTDAATIGASVTNPFSVDGIRLSHIPIAVESTSCQSQTEKDGDNPCSGQLSKKCALLRY